MGSLPLQHPCSSEVACGRAAHRGTGADGEPTARPSPRQALRLSSALQFSPAQPGRPPGAGGSAPTSSGSYQEGPPSHQHFPHPTAAAQGAPMETGASGPAQHLALTGGWRIFGQRPLINCAAPQHPPVPPGGGSRHGSEPARAQAAFRQCSQTHALFFGRSSGDPGVNSVTPVDPIRLLCGSVIPKHNRGTASSQRRGPDARCQPPAEAQWPPPAPPPPRPQPRWACACS